MVVKKLKSHSLTEACERPELLRTIRAGETFNELSDVLPKPNYTSNSKKK